MVPLITPNKSLPGKPEEKKSKKDRYQIDRPSRASFVPKLLYRRTPHLVGFVGGGGKYSADWSSLLDAFTPDSFGSGGLCGRGVLKWFLRGRSVVPPRRLNAKVRGVIGGRPFCPPNDPLVGERGKVGDWRSVRADIDIRRSSRSRCFARVSSVGKQEKMARPRWVAKMVLRVSVSEAGIL